MFVFVLNLHSFFFESSTNFRKTIKKYDFFVFRGIEISYIIL